MAETETVTTTAVATVEKVDNGKPALYNPAAFDQIWRAAKLFSSSDLVPACYKGKPENCFIAIEMADRLGINPFAVLQSLVIIQGKPAMEAKLITALVNDSGMFVDPLEYEVVGDDPFAADYKVRCFATMRKTGKLCLGPWIDYKMVKGEGWLDKGGSKWKTMPGIMFMYRAASFFAKIYCSNITMGMQTREEMEDTRPPVDVTPAPALVGAQESGAVEVVQIVKKEAVQTTTVVEVQPSTGTVTGAAAGTTGTPPARKRGEPSPGRKRRTAAEMEEDAAADLADQQAAAAASQPQSTLETCPCEHPTSRIDEVDGREYCDSCGVALDAPEPGEFEFPDLTAEQSTVTPQQVEDTLGKGAARETVQQTQTAAAVSGGETVDLF